MWRIFILTVLLAVAGKALEVKNCAQINFCQKFRHQTLNTTSQFAADLPRIKINSDATIATVPLFNLENKNLSLEITLLADNKIRLKVLEPESQQIQSRYALEDILDKEPKAVSLHVTHNENDTITLRPKDLKYNVIITNGPPFTVEFYLEDKLEIIFSGDRLVMENTNSSQPFTFGVEFEGASRLYGLAHHVFKIALDETDEGDPYRLRTIDYLKYEIANSTAARYGVIPVLYGHSVSQASGIFLHNAAEEWIDISYSGSRPSAYFMVESGVLDLFVFLGPSIKEAIRQYTSVTGVAHLPQLWALGYHQSRSTYFTQEEVKEVVAKLDAIDFPVDVIVIARAHTNGNRYFEWNPTNFSDPVEMQQNISASGRVIVPLLDTHFKVDDNYPVYVGAKNKYFIKYQNGTDYHGAVWAGKSGIFDFLNPEARDYYGSWYSFEKFVGSTETIAGIWNDMNEPTVFDSSTENSVPFDTVQNNGVFHRDVHNIYGFLNTKATHAALMIRDKGKKRPFVLSRSYFAGSQKYAAMWTGDNQAEWPLLASSYSECLTHNLAGMVFCGADVGGFGGNPDDELFQRWYQAGIWLPFYRAHSDYGTQRREPYLFSEKVQAVLRSAVVTRYKHIPVFYTLFYEHTMYGDPLIRPLLYDYPEYLEYDDHLLLGSDILSRPVLASKAETVNVTFPGSSTNYWYRVDNDSWDVYTGGTAEDVPVDINSAPYFYRGGSIIARRDTERTATSRMVDDPYTLYVNVDSNNRAEGRLYQDDYTSFEYVNSQSYLYVKITYVPESKGVQIQRIDGNSEGFDVRIQKVVIHSKSEDWLSTSATYTTTADGTPLETIDIVKELNLKRGPFVIHL